MTTYPLLSKPLLAFAFSAFAIGVSEFVVIGLLSQIAGDLGLDLTMAGLLITVYAAGVSIGGPLLAHLTRRSASKPVCLRLIWAFAATNLASAVMPSLLPIVIFRMISGAMHGAYFSIASTAAPAMVAPSRAPAAIAVMFSGLTVAMVLGVPTGIWLGQMFGWESVFLVISLLSAVAGILIHRFVPQIEDAIDSEEEARFSAYLNRGVMMLYGVTIFGFGGGFIFFSYVEPYLRKVSSFGPTEVAHIMLIVGFGSLFGNALGGKLLLALGLMRGLAVTITLQAIVLIGIGFSPHLPIVFLTLLFVWSMACFAVAPMVQSGVIMLATDHRGVNSRLSAGLNATAFNVGISVSTLAASYLVSVKGVPYLPFAAALAVAIALPLLLRSRSLNKMVT
jgi:DHA1 family inner membrane transport protein